MPYLASRFGRVYFVRWKSVSVPDLLRLGPEIAAARRGSDQPLFYFAVIPASANAPGPAERAALQQFGKELLPHVAGVHITVEGSGFVQSFHRSMLTGLFQVMRRFGNVPMHTYGSIAEAVAAIAKSARIDGITLLRELHERGLAFPGQTPQLAAV